MHIKTLEVGYLQTNCYIVRSEESDTWAVIDPGYEPETLLARLKELGLTLDAILLTHGHFDHVGAVEALVKDTGCKLWMSQSDYTQPKSPESDFFYPLHDCSFTEVQFCEEGEMIHAGGLTFTVMETPGHTYGSVCYLCEDAMFCGDTLFAGACGRTDLPGGDRTAMVESLDRLSELEAEYKVFPGHGGSTSLHREQQTNPYMRGYL